MSLLDNPLQFAPTLSLPPIYPLLQPKPAILYLQDVQSVHVPCNWIKACKVQAGHALI